MRTDSLMNAVLSDRRNPVPAIGMGATMLLWTDRHAATIVAVSDSGKSVTVQRDIARRTDSDGPCEVQGYTYEANPEAPKEKFTLRRSGRWVRMGEPEKSGTVLVLGMRNEYHDPSF